MILNRQFITGLLGVLVIAMQSLGQPAETVAVAFKLHEASGSNTNVIAPPKEVTWDTTQLLSQLAKDEYAAGFYSNSIFPRGSRLIYNGAFAVEGTAFSFSVSNILTLTVNSNALQWRTSAASGYPSREAWQRIITLNYNPVSSVGAMSFSASGIGLFTDSRSALTYPPTPPVHPGGPISTPTPVGSFYNESASMTAVLAGDGLDAEGNYFLISGALVASGSARELTPPSM